eukprot:3404308-Pyramimonas_sp.AAC.1
MPEGRSRQGQAGLLHRHWHGREQRQHDGPSCTVGVVLSGQEATRLSGTASTAWHERASPLGSASTTPSLQLRGVAIGRADDQRCRTCRV